MPFASFLESMASLRQCVTAFCLRCKDSDPWQVANCTATECALYPVRPNQALQNRFPEQFDADAVRQETLDAMDFKGLREIDHVRISDPRPAKQRTRKGRSPHRAIHESRAAIERIIRDGGRGRDA